MITSGWFRDSFVAACLGGVCYGVAIYLINGYLRSPTVALQCLILALAFTGMAWSWMVMVYRFIAGTHRAALIHLLTHVLLIAPYIFVWVYGILPLLGQPIHLENIPFDPVQFLSRAFSAGFMTAGFSVVYFLGMMLLSPKRLLPDRTVLKRLLAALDDRGSNRPISTHFLRNMMLSVGDYAATLPGAKGKKAISTWIALLEYVMDTTERELLLVDWRREWEQVGHLATLASVTHGASVVRLQQPAYPPSRSAMTMVPALSWLTLLENALLHGEYAEAQPILIELISTPSSIVFSCQNAYSKQSQRHQGQGTGLAWLADLGQVAIQDDGARFEVRFSMEKHHKVKNK